MDRVEWLEAMVEASDDGLLVLGLDGRVLGANRAAERLADLRCQAVIGQRASPPHDDSDFPWSIVGDAAGLRRVVSVVHTSRGGTKLLVTCKPVLAPDTTLSRLVVTLDKSRRQTDLYRRELRVAEARERQAGTVIGDGPALRALRDLALKYAAVDSPVLLPG